MHGMATARRLALAAAHRMVDRVHRDAAHVRLHAEPARATGLADLHVLVLDVADLADRRHARGLHVALLAARHAQRRELALARHQLRADARRADHLAALAGLQLDVVHDRAEGDVLERHRVAGPDLGVGARHHRVADAEPDGRQDVALLAVRVVQQRDARRAVRVVLDRRDLGRDAELVALEVDAAIQALVSAAAMPRRDVAAGVAAARLLVERPRRDRARAASS